MGQFFSFLLALVLAGSATAPARADDIGSRNEYIVNGDPAGQGDVRGTVAVALLSEDEAQGGFAPESLFSGAWCSGVLIAPTVVLTAAHCVEQCFWYTCAGSGGEQLDCYDCDPEPLPAERVYISAGSRTLDDMWSAEVVPVRDLIVPPAYEPSADWTLDVGHCEYDANDEVMCEKPGLGSDVHDVAVLLLDAPVTTLSPVRLLQDAGELAGVDGLAIGYGVRTESGDEELDTQDRYLSILHHTATPIEEVTDQEILTTSGENQGGVCYGDSGGPLYVQRGEGVFVAGVASRLRFDSNGPACGPGAIYTSVPSYADWIYEIAPATNPVELRDRGGCSAAPETPSGSGTLLVAMLLILSLRAGRRALILAPLVVVVSSLSGCGSSTADEVSFCNETHDPYGIFCNPGTEMLDLRTAEAIARTEVTEDAWLWMVRSSAVGLLDPDGRAESWTFAYYFPDARKLPEAEFREVTVYGGGTFVADPAIGVLACIPTEPIPIFDSRQLTHDAIRFIESHGTDVRLGDGGNLAIIQQHLCRGFGARRNYVRFRGVAAYFDDQGTFVGYDDDIFAAQH